jgi:peptide/nickel transport system substrate-binding protein
MQGFKRVAAVVLALMLMVLAGCSGSKTESPQGGSSVPAAKEQKPLVIALGADTRTLTPMKIVDQTSNQMLSQIYDYFLVRDPKTYQVAPNLAESYKVVDDLTWEFKLRKGIKFHDGEEFNAESIKATILAIQDAKFETQYKARFEMVKEILTPDPYTVILKTDKPSPILLLRLTELMPMPPAVIKEKGADALQQNPIGVGPFKFVKHVKDENLQLEANPDYWAGKPQVQKVTFKPIPEFSTRLSALLAGEVDIIQSVPTHAVDQVNNSGNAKVVSVPSSRVNYVALNNLKADSPFKDVRVRQAMNYAIDVDSIIKFVLDGKATRMPGALSEINPEVNKSLKPYPFDVNKAKQLLSEAGVDPTKLTLTLDAPQGRYPMDKEFTEAIATQLTKNLGIKVNVVFNEWGTHLDKIVKRTVGDMFVLGWGPAFDAEGTIGDLFVHDRTYSGFGDADLEKLINAARPIVDPAKRQAAWDKVQEETYKSAGWIFLWQQHDLYGVSNRVEFSPRADERIDVFSTKLKG